MSIDMPQVAPDTLLRLQERLVREAGPDLVDVAYRTVDTPIGTLLLAATPVGLVRLAFATEDFSAVLESLASRIGSRVLRSGSRLDEAARQLDGYFAGTLHDFDLPLDRRLSSGFRLTVQRELQRIAFGQTRSYGQVAAALGRPGASRAVGTACATNPLPIVVPCHRVLRSDGHLGGYAGGVDVKQRLLALETVLL